MFSKINIFFLQNSAINPILYTAMSLKFRRAFQRILLCGTVYYTNIYRLRPFTFISSYILACRVIRSIIAWWTESIVLFSPSIRLTEHSLLSYIAYKPFLFNEYIVHIFILLKQLTPNGIILWCIHKCKGRYIQLIEQCIAVEKTFVTSLSIVCLHVTLNGHLNASPVPSGWSMNWVLDWAI